MRHRSVLRVAGPALAFSIIAVALAQPEAAPQTTQAARGQAPVVVKLAPQPTDQGFVGADSCRPCHRPEFLEFNKTPHADVVADHATQRMDCESCHGPGKAHVDAEEAAKGDDTLTAAANKLIFSFKASPAENAERCLTCHVSARSQQGFAHSKHADVGVSCQNCHATHLVEAAYKDRLQKPPLPLAAIYDVPRPAVESRWLGDSLLKDRQPDLCYGCHAQIRAQFAQPFHHRVPEGALKCTDCHNPHGTENHATLTSPGWETCTKCHTDKRGPFLFEHGGVKVEGCAICHSPHGATARFMLNRRESRFLCLQCHGDAHSEQEQPGVPHSRLGFQTRGDCTRCHITIHGSNSNAEFLH